MKEKRESVPDRSVEQKRLLRDDGESLTELSESDGPNVDAVNLDLTLRQLDDAEEGLEECRFACRAEIVRLCSREGIETEKHTCSSPSDNAHLLPTFDLERDVVKDRR